MFLDSSVRSIRTISLRPPAAAVSAVTLRLHVRGRGPLAQFGRVHAQRVHADGGGVAAVPHGPRGLGPPRRPAPPRSSRGTRRPSAGRGTRRGRRRGCRRAPRGQRRRAASRNSPAAPTGCARSADRHVGAPVREHPGDQRQVVVLHHRAHAAAPGAAVRARAVGQGVGERRVVGAERVPFAAERRARNAAGSACRRACGGRTTGWSWRPRCRRGRTWRRRDVEHPHRRSRRGPGRRRGCRGSRPGRPGPPPGRRR